MITARANVGTEPTGFMGGHLNYYVHRAFPTVAGDRAAVSELVELPLPFTVDLVEASVDDIVFDFPSGHPAADLAPVAPLSTPSVMYGDVTFTYSAGRVIEDYLETSGSRYRPPLARSERAGGRRRQEPACS